MDPQGSLVNPLTCLNGTGLNAFPSQFMENPYPGRVNSEPVYEMIRATDPLRKSVAGGGLALQNLFTWNGHFISRSFKTQEIAAQMIPFVNILTYVYPSIRSGGARLVRE